MKKLMVILLVAVMVIAAALPAFAARKGGGEISEAKKEAIQAKKEARAEAKTNGEMPAEGKKGGRRGGNAERDVTANEDGSKTITTTKTNKNGDTVQTVKTISSTTTQGTAGDKYKDNVNKDVTDNGDGTKTVTVTGQIKQDTPVTKTTTVETTKTVTKDVQKEVKSTNAADAGLSMSGSNDQGQGFTIKSNGSAFTGTVVVTYKRQDGNNEQRTVTLTMENGKIVGAVGPGATLNANGSVYIKDGEKASGVNVAGWVPGTDTTTKSWSKEYSKDLDPITSSKEFERTFTIKGKDGDPDEEIKVVIKPNPKPNPNPDPDPDPDPVNRRRGGNNTGSPFAPTTANIAAPDVPLAENPLTDIAEQQVPLADIPDAPVPLADIPDTPVPLGSMPVTGENDVIWLMLAGLSLSLIMAAASVELLGRCGKH